MKKNNDPERGSSKNIVKKPFLTGNIFDENTLKNGMIFIGTLIIVFFIVFIACASASFGNLVLRLAVNLAVIAICMMIFYNNGAGRGSEAVARGEILFQKQEKGREFSESERRISFHPLKGYLTGLIGTIPFLIAAVILAFTATIQTTGSGTLPAWMQAYTQRSDIGNALVNYTQPEGMQTVDYLRAVIRICILPFVNIAGISNKNGLLIVEKISPLILMLPALSYGTGYMTGKKIRTRIHTVISENDKKRIKKETRLRKKREGSSRERTPESLN